MFTLCYNWSLALQELSIARESTWVPIPNTSSGFQRGKKWTYGLELITGWGGATIGRKDALLYFINP